MAHYGIGPLTAVVILAELGDARRFSSAREASEETLALAEQIAQGEAAARLRAQVAQRHPEARLDQVEDAFQEACLLAVRRARAPSDGLLPAGGPSPLRRPHNSNQLRLGGASGLLGRCAARLIRSH